MFYGWVVLLVSVAVRVVGMTGSLRNIAFIVPVSTTVTPTNHASRLVLLLGRRLPSPPVRPRTATVAAAPNRH